MRWLNRTVKYITLLYLSGLSGVASAQTLTLEEACKQAKEQYPLTRQKDLVKQVADLSISNLGRGLWPQLSVNGQASYQSDVTTVSIPIPGIKMNPLSKDQYRLVADLSQVIYDGGLTSRQQELQQLNMQVEEQRIETELYKLKDRVTQLYLGVLLLDQQLKQVGLVQKDLETGLKTMEAQVINGVALRSQRDAIKAELLKTGQRIIELQTARKGLLDILGLFLNQSLPETTILIMPSAPGTGREIQRPELKLFEAQQKVLEEQKKLVDARLIPRTYAYGQAGYGRPGLNMLKNRFEPFYIVGVRLSWPLSGFYTRHQDKKLTDINYQIVGIQREVFLLNTNMQLKQQAAEVDKWQRLVETDQEIITLRQSIKEAARAQLENSVITANDYVREVNAEDAARQNLILHKLQLLQALINYQNILGTSNNQ